MKKDINTTLLFLPKQMQLYIKESALLLKTNDLFIIFPITKNIKLKKTKNILTILWSNSIAGTAQLNTWVKNFRNLVYGSNRGFNMRLLLKGIGFKANIIDLKKQEHELELKLGHSHTIKKILSPLVKVNIHKNTILSFNSSFKDLLGRESAKIYSLREPDPYKGKGILYHGQKLSLKVGKKA